jgi:hypothetical protein
MIIVTMITPYKIPSYIISTMRRAHTASNQLRDPGFGQANRPSETEITRSLIQSVIKQRFGGQIAMPQEGEQFDTSEDAFQRVQQYAFASGFAVVQTQIDLKNERRVFSCVHSGKTKDTHKLLDSTGIVSKETFEELGGLDDDGKKLRLREGKVSHNS